MLCIGQGEVDWDAVSAIGTNLAVLVALLASWLAIRAPEWSKQSDRREATQEVLRATAESIDIYRRASELVAMKRWPDEHVTKLRVRADHQFETLNRLISRTSLTDGGVAVGAGAMSIMATIREIPTSRELKQASVRSGDSGLARYIDSVGPARVALEAAADVVEVVEARAHDVRVYASRRWWHRFFGRSDPTPVHHGAVEAKA